MHFEERHELYTYILGDLKRLSIFSNCLSRVSHRAACYDIPLPFYYVESYTVLLNSVTIESASSLYKLDPHTMLVHCTSISIRRWSSMLVYPNKTRLTIIDTIQENIEGPMDGVNY